MLHIFITAGIGVFFFLLNDLSKNFQCNLIDILTFKIYSVFQTRYQADNKFSTHGKIRKTVIYNLPRFAL